MTTDRNGQTLAVGLLVLAAAVAGIAIALPVQWAVQLRGEIQSVEDRLAGIRNAVREGRVIDDAATTGILVSGSSAGRAAAELQNRLGVSARRHGIALRSLQVLDSRRQGELNEIPLEVSYQTGVVELRGLLHEIESGMPIMVVDELNIRAVTPPSGAASAPVLLDVSMKVRGFAAPGDKS